MITIVDNMTTEKKEESMKDTVQLIDEIKKSELKRGEL